ncbi:MAG: hypothetical protein GF365_00970 [Candidatus Buchananbacteria bacterium]|nr:hypothetical protein [Candidatus Buchananbacteria bacterium]
MNIKWFKSKSKWLQYSLLGAVGYPAIVFIFFILSFISTPLGLRNFFEKIIAIVVFPAARISLGLVYRLVDNPLDYGIPMIGFIIFFTILIGFLIGLFIFFIKSIYQKIEEFLDTRKL